MTAILLKSVHVIAIALWSSGLLCLPFLYLQRRDLADDALHSLHNFTRFLYISLVSPAAFIAVASGIVLIFLQATFEPWFSVKLALVAGLVIIHVTSGLLILRLFEPGQSYPWWRFVVASGITTAVVAAILVTVLAKPRWLSATEFATLFAPGALGEMLGITAWLR